MEKESDPFGSEEGEIADRVDRQQQGEELDKLWGVEVAEFESEFGMKSAWRS